MVPHLPIAYLIGGTTTGVMAVKVPGLVEAIRFATVSMIEHL